MATTQTPRRLVCGLDDSEHAPVVASVATELAARLDLRLCVVHSADPDLRIVGDRRRRLLRDGEELLDELLGRGVPHDRIVDLGEPASLLRDVLAEGAALAVVGSRGRGPIRAAAFGSVSMAVADAAPCPVVVVPPDSADQVSAGPATVVCGVDGSAGAADALAAGADLARALGSDLVAVHVDAGPVPMTGAAAGMPAWPTMAWDQARQAGRAIVQRAVDELDTDLPVRMRCDIGDPAERLATIAAEQPSAIIVVGSRGHGPLRSALLGSVSTRLCASAPVPVVVVPHGATLAGLQARRADAVPAQAQV